MGPLGLPELIFILVLALLIFGPKRLPEIGRTIGKGMAEFRKASTELTRSINTELALDETPAPPPARTWEAPAMTAARPPQPAPPPAETVETLETVAAVTAVETVETATADINEPVEPS
jgi:TatA/E family protein of Tat protein translocase